MLRIANWDYNCVRATEGLDVGTVPKILRQRGGNPLLRKWCEFKFNFFKMIRYFSQYTDAGQTFCNIVMKQVEGYEEKKHEAKVNNSMKRWN